MKRRFYIQVYLGLLVTAILCAELTFFAILGERALLTRSEPVPAASVPLPDGGAAEAAVDVAPGAASASTRVARAIQGLPPFARAQVFVLIVLVSMAIGAIPMARRATRRLERLQAGVEELAAGDLASRVVVDGEDEIAELAMSFNRAAGQIEQLVAAQRRMLASASHELRTPLTHVRANLELLADELVAKGSGPRLDPAQREKLLAEAEADIEELDALIGDLLLTSRLSAGPRLAPSGRVELVEALGEVASRFGVSLEAKPVRIRGDRRALQRMMRNLLENAQRHAGGASLEVGLEALPGSGGARVIVADRGPGVPEEHREQIFEPFYRPADHDQGTDAGVGLGLALVREIARFHGGDVRCLPREGGGTRFEVDLRGAGGRAAPPA